MRWGAIAFVVVGGVTGCAATKPEHALREAQESIREAEEAGARADYAASMYLDEASVTVELARYRTRARSETSLGLFTVPLPMRTPPGPARSM